MIGIQQLQTKKTLELCLLRIENLTWISHVYLDENLANVFIVSQWYFQCIILKLLKKLFRLTCIILRLTCKILLSLCIRSIK